MSGTANSLSTVQGYVDCFELTHSPERGWVFDVDGVSTISAVVEGDQLLELTVRAEEGVGIPWHHHDVAERHEILEGGVGLWVIESTSRPKLPVVAQLLAGDTFGVSPFQTHAAVYHAGGAVHKCSFSPPIRWVEKGE